MVASNGALSGEGQHLSDGIAEESVVKSKSAAESTVDTNLLAEQTDKPHSPTQTPAPEEPPKEPSPEEILAEKRAKLALWNELKITGMCRMLRNLPVRLLTDDSQLSREP